MNELEFHVIVGRPPVQDDLERANCDKAGQMGHWFCGTCPTCGSPIFLANNACCVTAGEENRRRNG